MSSILANYYDILTEIIIANGTKVKIDPDKPYTVTFYRDDRTIGQSTGIIRGVIGETHTIVMIPLNKENVNYATIIDTYKIEDIKTYTFNAHFTEFNNWVGVEVAENQSIDVRIKYATGESIVRVETGITYEVSYVTSTNGEMYLKSGFGKVISISRSATREYMPNYHAGHFSNRTDYIIQFDFGETNKSCIESVNVLDIRTIRTYVEAPVPVDRSELKTLIAIEEQMHRLDTPELYVYHTFDHYKDAMMRAYAVIHNDKSTEDDIDGALCDLKNAITNLRLEAYDKDLIEFNAEKGILYLNESKMPVRIVGSEFEEYQVVHYFTAFGSPKKLCVPNNISVFYTYPSVDFENIKPITPEEKTPMCQDCLDTIQEFRAKHTYANIIVENARLGSVYLGRSYGYSSIPDKDGNMVAITPDGSPFLYGSVYNKAKFINSHINELYLGGASKNTISDGAIVNIEGCEVTSIFGGSFSEEDQVFVEGEETLDTPKDLPVYETSTINIKNSTVDTVYCTGVRNFSSNSCVIIDGRSTIKNIYGVTHGSLANNPTISINHNSIVDNIVGLETGSKLTGKLDISLSNSAKVNKVTVGAEQPEWGWFVEPEPEDDQDERKHMVNITLSMASEIGTIVRGYNGSNQVKDELVQITIPQCKIGDNAFDTPLPTITFTLWEQKLQLYPT